MSTEQTIPEQPDAANAAQRPDAIGKAFAAAPAPTDHPAMREFVHTLAGLGLHLLFIDPGTKEPTDFRSPRERRKRYKERQGFPASMQSSGGSSGESAPKRGGVYLATTDTDTLNRYFTTYVRRYGRGCAINLAVAVGPSRIVVVDCDTPPQVAAFIESNPDADRTPTVSTPGKRDPETGEWIHHDGGHWWYVVREGVNMPKSTHAVTLGDGDKAGRYSVLCGQRYVLIPPSIRTEGPYKTTGPVTLLTDRLAGEVIERAQHRAQRDQRIRERVATGRLTAAQRWGNEITWDDILTGTGWVNTGDTYSECGCDIWTAPGPHASERSAVAHEPGCGRWTDSPDPPLYCFTDHDRDPFETIIDRTGRPTVTRLEAVAAIHYDSDIGKMMCAFDKYREERGWGSDLPQFGDEDPEAESITDEDPEAESDEDEDPDEDDAEDRVRAYFHGADHLPLTVTKMAPFPMHVLPPVIADMATAEARDLGIDPAMTAVFGLGAVSGALCGRVVIEVRPGWAENGVVYIVTVAESGDLKSPAYEAMFAVPLRAAERELISRWMGAEHVTLDTAVDDGGVEMIGTANGGGGENEADEDEADEAEREPFPRLLASDITTEKLGVLDVGAARHHDRRRFRGRRVRLPVGAVQPDAQPDPVPGLLRPARPHRRPGQPQLHPARRPIADAVPGNSA